MMNLLFKKLQTQPNFIVIDFSKTNNENQFIEKNPSITFQYKDYCFRIIEKGPVTYITGYKILNALEMIKVLNAESVKNLAQINDFIKRCKTAPIISNIKESICPSLNITYDGKSILFLLKNKIAGNYEREVLNNLKQIEMVRNSGGYKILSFYHYNGKDYFEFDINSLKITN